MFNIKDLTADQLLLRTDRYEDAPATDADAKVVAEIVTQSGHNIPMLHLVWHPSTYVITRDKEQADALVAAGFTVTERMDSGRAYYTFHVQARAERHVWFCNFRRYAWSWSHSEDAHDGSGFGHGETYANGHTLGDLAKTPEDVVRLTAVQSWERLSREELPTILKTRAIQDAVTFLVEDAVKNVSRHANPDHRTSGWCSVQVEVVRRHMSVPAVGDELAV